LLGLSAFPLIFLPIWGKTALWRGLLTRDDRGGGGDGTSSRLQVPNDQPALVRAWRKREFRAEGEVLPP